MMHPLPLTILLAVDIDIDIGIDIDNLFQSTSIPSSNPFDALSSEGSVNESKQYDSSTHSLKDDIKSQHAELRSGTKQLKGSMVNVSGGGSIGSLTSGGISTGGVTGGTGSGLKETVLAKGENLLHTVQEQLSQGVELAKEKVLPKVGIHSTTSSVGSGSTSLDKDKLVNSANEIVEGVQDSVGEQWQTVKRKGKTQLKKMEQKIENELLDTQQKQKLHQIKREGMKVERRINTWARHLVNIGLAGRWLRPIRAFIQRNNLQLPFVVCMFVLTLWSCLTIIRLITTITSPPVPEFDIHSKENTINWLKYHAGEYKDKAADMSDDLAARAAKFLSRYGYDFDSIKGKAIDWKHIGMMELGLEEPTWSEAIYAWVTGRPITWQDRVTSILNLAKQGINRSDLRSHGLKQTLIDLKNSAVDISEDFIYKLKHLLPSSSQPIMEPSWTDTIRDHLPSGLQGPSVLNRDEGFVQGLKHRLEDGVESIRSHLPGGGQPNTVTSRMGEGIESLRQRAYEATHPSTMQNLQTHAEYVKNRVVHGAQELGHNVQDRFNEGMDNIKWKTGL